MPSDFVVRRKIREPGGAQKSDRKTDQRLTIKIVIETSAQSRDHVVCTEFEGGEGILVDLNTKRYYQLNETALLIWKGLENGRTVDEIVNEVLAQYAVDPRHARQSVETLLRSLISYRLVES